jgi:hypothetical protein
MTKSVLRIVAIGVPIVALVLGGIYMLSARNRIRGAGAESATPRTGSVPPIDAAAPAETEVATFALG